MSKYTVYWKEKDELKIKTNLCDLLLLIMVLCVSKLD